MGDKVYLTTNNTLTKPNNPVPRVQRAALRHPLNAPAEQVLNLQRTIGNRAVQRMLNARVVEPKLEIGEPNDIYEQEADRIAEHVMSMPDPRLQRQGIEEEEGKEEPAQTKAVSSQSPKGGSSLEATISSARNHGQPLPESVRSFFELRFDSDLSHVRLHTGDHAAETAQSINAKAFTIGKDIVFGSGQYSPQSNEGRRLLAHELTHVIQQDGGAIQNQHQVVQGDTKHSNNRSVPVIAFPQISQSRKPTIFRVRISSSCSSHDQAIRNANHIAYTALAEVNQITDNISTPAVQQAALNHFGIDLTSNRLLQRIRWGRVKRNLSRMLSQARSPQYNCIPQNTGLCQNRPAWTGASINICPKMWSHAGYSSDEVRAAIIIHELGHYSGIRWGKETYCGTAGYAGLSALQRIRTPDAYMQFVCSLASNLSSSLSSCCIW